MDKESRTILEGFDALLVRDSAGDEGVAVAGGVETFDRELARRRLVAVVFWPGAMVYWWSATIIVVKLVEALPKVGYELLFDPEEGT